MPIGKNAIKRVTDNGYSKVKTSAPDMENSVVEAEKRDVIVEKLTPPSPAPKRAAKPRAAKAVTEKKAPNKVTPKKSMETEPSLSPVKTAEKITKKPTKAKRQEKGYINIGGELPIHLL